MIELTKNPKFWGDPAWTFLFCSAYSYPENPTAIDKKNFKKFFLGLGDVLPCYMCRNNFKSHISKYPLTEQVLDSRKNFVKWLFKIRNCVDDITGSKRYTEKDIFDKVTSFYEKKTPYLLYILPIVIICIVLLYHFKIKKPK